MNFKVIFVVITVFHTICFSQLIKPPFERITSDFGPRNATGATWFHQGIDYNPESGDVLGVPKDDFDTTAEYLGEYQWIGDPENRYYLTPGIPNVNPPIVNSFAVNLNNVIVYPNPFKLEPRNNFYRNGGIIFSNLTDDARIRIYNLTGELILDTNKNSGDSDYKWNHSCPLKV